MPYCTHNKTGHRYVILHQKVINATNNNDGQLMVFYSRLDKFFVREVTEFLEKFTIDE